ncbi:MAG: DMT family transporter [Hyphomicrobiales bacterium]
MITRPLAGIAAALIAACFYGTIPNFARAAFTNGVPGIDSSFLRTTVIALVLGGLSVARGVSLRVPTAGYWSFAGLAVSTLVISVSYLVAVQFIPVALAVIIFFTFPVIILITAPLVEGHAPGPRRVLIGLMAFAGLAIAVGPGFNDLDIRGIALAAAAASGATLQFYSGRLVSRHLDPAAFGSLVHLAIWLPSLAIVLWLGDGAIRSFLPGQASAIGWIWAFALSGAYVAAYFFHMVSLKHAPASVVAPFFNLEPIVATLIAAIFLGETLAVNQYAGGAVVLVALVLSSRITAAGRARHGSPSERKRAEIS